jgi:hypothetical protein
MPPRKRSTVVVEESFPSDLDSDSDDDDRVCLDIGKQAARDMLSDRTRESYSASMRRMISWTLKQNSALHKHCTAQAIQNHCTVQLQPCDNLHGRVEREKG